MRQRCPVPWYARPRYVLGVALLVLGYAGFLSQAGRGTLAQAVGGLALLALATVWGVTSLAEAFATYEWDEHGLRLHRWWGAWSVGWDEIADYEVRRVRYEARYVLRDPSGQPRVVDFRDRSGNGLPLAEELRRRLAPVTERKLAEFDGDGRLLRTSRWRRWVTPLSVPVIAAATAAALGQGVGSKGDSAWDALNMGAVLAASCLWLVVSWRHWYGADIRIDRGGVKAYWPDMTQELAWSDIERVELTGTGIQTGPLVLCSGAIRLRLPNDLPDWLPAAEYIQRRTGRPFVSANPWGARQMSGTVWLHLVRTLATQEPPKPGVPDGPPKGSTKLVVTSVGGILGVSLGLLGALTAVAYRQDQAAWAHPTVVSARVTGIRAADHPGEGGHLAYTFNTPTGQVTAESGPLGPDLSRYQQGQWVAVHYPAGKPHHSSPADQPLPPPAVRDGLPLALIATPLGLLLLLLSAPEFLRLLQAQQRYFAAGGTPKG